MGWERTWEYLVGQEKDLGVSHGTGKGPGNVLWDGKTIWEYLTGQKGQGKDLGASQGQEGQEKYLRISHGMGK